MLQQEQCGTESEPDDEQKQVMQPHAMHITLSNPTWVL